MHAVLILIASEAHLIEPAARGDLHLYPLGKRVDDRCAHAVQTAGIGIAVVAELAAGVQLGKNHLDARNAELLVNADGYPAAVILNSSRAVPFESDRNGVGKPVRRLVDGVVNYLPKQMMKSPRPGRPDIHTGAHPDGLEPFHDFYIAYRIIVHLVASFGTKIYIYIILVFIPIVNPTGCGRSERKRRFPKGSVFHTPDYSLSWQPQ